MAKFKTSCTLNLNSNLMELTPHGDESFPCAAFEETHTDSLGDEVSWHYHDDVEITYVKEGKGEFKAPEETYILNEGDLIFFSSNVLHYSRSLTKKLVTDTLVFSSSLIDPSPLSIISTKYLRPMISSKKLRTIVFKSETKSHMTTLFLEAFKAIRNKDEAYEFLAKNRLSEFFYSLYISNLDSIEKKPKEILSEKRLQMMLSYINENIGEEIGLKEIASSANVSEREALRSFSKAIGISPLQYVLRRRLLIAGALLKDDPSRKIEEVAIQVGFSSSSYFSKLFRRYYGISPTEYLKDND